MQRSHVLGLRLTAAIGTVLAVALVGSHAVAAPASVRMSTPVMAAETAEAQVPYPSVSRSRLNSVGSSGFLVHDQSTPLWTNFADGSTSVVKAKSWAGEYVKASATATLASDVVAIEHYEGGLKITELRDMSTQRSVGISPDGAGNRLVGYVGFQYFVRRWNSASTEEVQLLEKADDGKLTKLVVTGLPLDAKEATLAAATPEHAVLVYQTSRTWQWALVDLATAAVVQRHDMRSASDSVAVSDTHVAWHETDDAGTDRVVVTARGANPAPDRSTVLGKVRGTVAVGLVGSWVAYGVNSDLAWQDDPSPLYALTARNLTTNATRKLLDHTGEVATAPDGTLYASGGTVSGGEGLYRIPMGSAGAPVATRVASSGEPVGVGFLGDSVPEVIDLDAPGPARFTWRLSRLNVLVNVTLRNTYTGETKQETLRPYASPDDLHSFSFEWDGELAWHNNPDFYTPASAGNYTWRIDVKPRNGIGPGLSESGSFTVKRESGTHDYDGDGQPDILERDTAGRLWLSDTTYEPYDELYQNPQTFVGGGWNVYDRIEASGNLGGAPVDDLVARDRNGVLYLYLGTGDSKAPFTSRIRIGGGWNTYVQLTGGSDLNGDGRADLVAADKSGALWLYRGTGNHKTPFKKRVKIGTGGWGTYDQILAVGDIAGAPAGDLVARDRSGVLWLYLGYGNGHFAPRTRIGGGWNTYSHLVNIGDANLDDRPDLYGINRDVPTSPFLHRATGAWRTPFAVRSKVPTVFYGPQTYDLFA
ncbi:FG-GAP repeat domain-containing protein [Streptomyces sp. NPDC056337]|uniref:FG-GAP repeat domain-containing protein n=1 Tax=Streptomyces sp. NPDC056337 TaxID=3345787 RepID=UPI0035D6F5F6